jgi:hypothetical protein
MRPGTRRSCCASRRQAGADGPPAAQRSASAKRTGGRGRGSTSRANLRTAAAHGQRRRTQLHPQWRPTSIIATGGVSINARLPTSPRVRAHRAGAPMRAAARRRLPAASMGPPEVRGAGCRLWHAPVAALIARSWRTRPVARETAATRSDRQVLPQSRGASARLAVAGPRAGNRTRTAGTLPLSASTAGRSAAGGYPAGQAVAPIPATPTDRPTSAARGLGS